MVLTRDWRIRYRKLEKDALKEFGVGAFTFGGGQAAGLQMSICISNLIPKMNLKAQKEPRPFLFTFGLVGIVTKVSISFRPGALNPRSLKAYGSESRKPQLLNNLRMQNMSPA